MVLKEILKEDLKAAMKSGDSHKRTTIGMLLSAVKNRELDKRSKLSKSGTADSELEEKSQLTDEEIIETVSSEIKKRKESASVFESSGRPELAAGEKAEVEMLVKYMPEQMSEDDIRKEVKSVISQTGATIKEMGKVIGQVMAKLKGKADGQAVNRIVKEELGNN